MRVGSEYTIYSMLLTYTVMEICSSMSHKCHILFATKNSNYVWIHAGTKHYRDSLLLQKELKVYKTVMQSLDIQNIYTSAKINQVNEWGWDAPSKKSWKPQRRLDMT